MIIIDHFRQMAGTTFQDNTENMTHIPICIAQEIQAQGGGDVLFNVRIENPPICGTRLAKQGIAKQHSNNKNGLAICISTPYPSAHRLFTRCFSSHCSTGGGSRWVELAQQHADIIVLRVAPRMHI